MSKSCPEELEATELTRKPLAAGESKHNVCIVDLSSSGLAVSEKPSSLSVCTTLRMNVYLHCALTISWTPGQIVFFLPF